jgi:hypothetical protein
VHDEIKNTVVIAMDGEYAGNAGAISCHLIGEERVFGFIRCVKMSPKSAYCWCVDLRDSTAFFRFKLSNKF